MRNIQNPSNPRTRGFEKERSLTFVRDDKSLHVIQSRCLSSETTYDPRSNLGDGSVWERSLTEFTLSLSEGFEMTNADLVVVPARKEYFSS